MATEVIGEFLGTLILVLLGDGVCANVNLARTKGHNAGWLTITIGWGLAVMVAAYASGYLSPAHLNPAVTIAFAIEGSTPWSSVPAYIIGQMLGAFLGAVILWLHYRDHFNVTEDPDMILGSFATAPEIHAPANNLISEAIGTFILTFGIMSFAQNDLAPGLSTALVGGLIVSIGASLGGPTGYAINPARDLGPRIAHAILPIPHKGDSDWAYAWIPVVGPIIGGVLAAIVFQWIP
ncbi:MULTISPECIES: MIP/aquaporin family protein [Aerococcus]|uniref:Aquaporin family protein n=2 Tax=Aerococcus TaxID=1375 RepID=A0A178HGI1_9LACT|nr:MULTISPECIES: MIP/aquaporin family protein [Aerococcus]KAA9221127.1 aquaporin family protein [Aerococcus loyolae]KAA9264631.1 aquaporin family protein [Aerococcus loyolae]MCY3025426.1 aquaporin family protein [Aerococcus loyolae]MCY3026629.1 aquaporin family protein [Aerococcus loyolae]MCY3028264.1 aquaporin family protein [Aerococcus loyolae]